jgi:hypothetical protein
MHQQYVFFLSFIRTCMWVYRVEASMRYTHLHFNVTFNSLTYNTMILELHNTF